MVKQPIPYRDLVPEGYVPLTHKLIRENGQSISLVYSAVLRRRPPEGFRKIGAAWYVKPNALAKVTKARHNKRRANWDDCL